MSGAETQNLLDTSDDDLKAMGLPPSFTLEELQQYLSEDEIKSLASGDDPLISMPDATAKADDDDEDADEDEDEEEDEDNAAADAAATSDGDGDKKTGDDAVKDDAPDPVYTRTDTADATATIGAAADERKALRDSYNDGDLTDEEYDEKLNEIAEKIADAKIALKEAEKADAQSLSDMQNAWYGKVDRFLDANPAFRGNEPIPEMEGYSYLTALDEVLKNITADARYAGMTMDQRIEAGARIVREYVQKQTGADIPIAAGGKPAKTPTPKPDPLAAAKAEVEKAGKRPSAVQTLGSVTAATETEASTSRFATIDREGSGLMREREFNRLSPEEQDAFLAGN